MNRHTRRNGRKRNTERLAAAGFVIRLAWQADPWRMLGTLLVQILMAAGVLAAVLLVREVFGDVFTRGVDGTSAEGLFSILALAVAGATVAGVLRNLSQSWLRVLGVKLDRRLIAHVLDRASAAELAEFERPSFHDRLHRAVFASRAQPMVLIGGLVVMAQAVLTVLAVAVVLTVLAWWLVPLCVAAALPVLKAARDERDGRYRLHRDLSEHHRFRTYVERLLTGRDEAKELRALQLGPHLRQRWDAQYAAEIGRTVLLQRTHTRRGIVARLLTDTAVLAIVGFAWWLVHTGRLPPATAVAALTALWLLSARVQMVGHLLNNAGETIMYLTDLHAFVSSPAPRASTKATPAAPSASADRTSEQGPSFRTLAAKGVSFTYPGSDHRILHDVDLSLRAGQVVALVGENGSGKTTLAKILAGLYPPTQGRLLCDGIPVTNPEVIRRQTAIVFQDFLRYRLSATDNIAFGRVDAPGGPRAVHRAARRAGADRFLHDLPAGYDTVLSTEFTGGTDLSLGQWQRLALARAFYRDAPLVILDEPTASLDPQAEADLFDELRRLFDDRMVLLISHRFSSVRNADWTYVLDAGRVVEEGTHDTLIASDGTYARLFGVQAGTDEPTWQVTRAARSSGARG